MDSKLIEAAARALCIRDEADPDGVSYDRTGRDLPNWYVVQADAEAAILAFLDAAAGDEGTVEKVARAICAGQGLDWKDQFSIYSSNGDPLAHEAFRHDARAALSALKAEVKP